MAIFKLNISDPKSKKSYKKELETVAFKGKKIGDNIKGEEIGFKDYEFEITGGSDSSGFPHIKHLQGAGRKKVLLSRGKGVTINRRGLRLRKTVVGNQLSLKTSQVNLKVTKYGHESVEKVLGIESKEEVKADKNEV
ncbi:MAG: S6e family ribosomal protein [Candidatus Nanoarchaeia archaeon]|nr:S6e family ribosomal protein [Candidatus Nanoarchaeia archaeon]